MGNSISQKLKYKQSVIKFSFKYGVTKAAIKFGESRRTIYRWIQRYDGTLESLINDNLFNSLNTEIDNIKNLDLDTKVDKTASNYFAQVNNLGLSETNTLINFMVNKGVSKFPSFYSDGRNLIVDDRGEARFINYVSTQEQSNFNIVSYVCNDGDIRNRFTQHKLYQIF